MSNNASSNNMMAEHMGEMATHCSSPASQVRCVLHITNLVAKSFIKLFDTLKNGHLWSPEGDLETESDEQSKDVHRMGMQSIGDIEEDNIKGWVDEVALLTHAKHAQLDEDIHPLWMILIKIS